MSHFQHTILYSYLHDSGLPIPEDDFEEFEKRFDLRMPECYKQFIRSKNGGRSYHSDSLQHKCNPTNFYRRNYVRGFELYCFSQLEYIIHDMWNMNCDHVGRIPKNYFVIGADVKSEDLLLMNSKGQHDICLWIRDEELDDGLKKCVELAPSFEVFVHGVERQSLEERYRWNVDNKNEPYCFIESQDHHALSQWFSSSKVSLISIEEKKKMVSTAFRSTNLYAANLLLSSGFPVLLQEFEYANSPFFLSIFDCYVDMMILLFHFGEDPNSELFLEKRSKNEHLETVCNQWLSGERKYNDITFVF